jgi:predicted SnoaL-like aldol condensation-catalyzing enzyme
MPQSEQERNKAVVLEAFDALFNRRDYETAEPYWDPGYIQHSAHIQPGRDGLFNLVKGLPDTLRHETELIMAEGDMVMLRGRFTGHGLPAPWIAVDTVRMENGLLKEHWDVIEDEVSREGSQSGLPMYGDAFPEER